MSIEIMSRIWYREDIEKNLKWTLMALADAANDEGFCWPSVHTLSVKTALSERAVQRALAEAVQTGMLRRRHRKDRSTQYIFVLERFPHVQRKSRPKETGPLAEIPDHEWSDAAEPDLFAGVEQPENGKETPDDGDLDHGCQAVTRGDEGRVTGSHPTGVRQSPHGCLAVTQNHKRNINEPSSTGALDFQSNAIMVEWVSESWNRFAAEHPNVTGLRLPLSDERIELIERRARSFSKGITKRAFWEEFFGQLRRSQFLQGRAKPTPKWPRPFKLSLQWALTQKNLQEIIDGRYEDDSNTSQPALSTSAAATARFIASLDAD
jgi:hypothetical protein